MCNLFLKTSLEMVETIADCKESNVHVDNTMQKMSTNATNHLGILLKRIKNASYPFSSPTVKSPDQTARNPVVPINVQMAKVTNAAMEVPIHKSLSVLLAKVLNQNPDIKQSFVTMATNKM